MEEMVTRNGLEGWFGDDMEWGRMDRGWVGLGMEWWEKVEVP